MKRILFFFMMLAMTSCATWKNVPERLDKFVGEAEENVSNYSQSDWEQSKQAYQNMISDFSEHEEEYTPEERRVVMKAIGRYHGLLIVHSLRDAWEFLKTMIQILPDYWEGVKDVFKEFISDKKQEISDLVQTLIDPEGIDKTIKNLVQDWDNLLDGVSSEIESALEEYEYEE